jgi:hypothetical protein
MLMPRQLPFLFFIAKGGTSRMATMNSRSGKAGVTAEAGSAWPRLQASASIAQTTMARGQFTFIASPPRPEQASAAGRAFGLRRRSTAPQCLPPMIGPQPVAYLTKKATVR